MGAGKERQALGAPVRTQEEAGGYPDWENKNESIGSEKWHGSWAGALVS